MLEKPFSLSLMAIPGGVDDDIDGFYYDVANAASLQVSWAQVLASLEAALAVVTGLVSFCALSGHRRTGIDQSKDSIGQIDQ